MEDLQLLVLLISKVLVVHLMEEYLLLFLRRDFAQRVLLRLWAYRGIAMLGIVMEVMLLLLLTIHLVRH